MKRNFGEVCELAQAEAIGFNEFAQKTAARWGWWSRRFDRKFRLPAWFGLDDVQQELLVAAWIAATKFDPSRGKTAARYIEWNAVKRTTKAVQKARGVEQHRRKGPPTPELLECTFANQTLPEVASEGISPLGEFERNELFGIAAQLAGDELSRGAIRALAREGSAELAAASLYADTQTRLRARLHSQEAALQFVLRSVDSVVERFGSKEAQS